MILSAEPLWNVAFMIRESLLDRKNDSLSNDALSLSPSLILDSTWMKTSNWSWQFLTTRTPENLMNAPCEYLQNYTVNYSNITLSWFLSLSLSPPPSSLLSPSYKISFLRFLTRFYRNALVMVSFLFSYVIFLSFLKIKIISHSNYKSWSQLWWHRNQAKLQRNLMYLAAIADSQPQMPTVTQVIISSNSFFTFTSSCFRIIHFFTQVLILEFQFLDF